MPNERGQGAIPKSEGAPLQRDVDTLRAAEVRKAIAEAAEAELRVAQLQKGWLTPRIFFQACLGGLVAAGLLAAWVIAFLQPILTAEVRLAKIKRETLETKAAAVAADTRAAEVDRDAIADEKKRVESDLAVLQSENLSLSARLKESLESAEKEKKRYQDLALQAEQLVAEAEAAGEEQDRLRALQKSAQAEADRLEEVVEQLQSEGKESADRAGVLEARRVALLLRSYEVWLYPSEEGQRTEAERLQKQLRDYGIESSIGTSAFEDAHREIKISDGADPAIFSWLSRSLPGDWTRGTIESQTDVWIYF